MVLTPHYIASVSTVQPYQMNYRVVLETTIVNGGQDDFDLTLNSYTDPSVPLFVSSELQSVRVVDCSHQLEEVIDRDGNPVGRFVINTVLHRGGSLTLSVEYLATVYLTDQRRSGPTPLLGPEHSGTKSEIPSSLVNNYCKAGGPWSLDDADDSWHKLRELASQLAGNESNVLAIALRLVEWVGKNVKYPGNRRDRISLPNETLAHLEGDCDEQSNLLISMLRHVGVPAFLQTGALYVPSREVDQTLLSGHVRSIMSSISWHAWSMAYVPPWGWLPFDMTIGYGGGSPTEAISDAASATLSTIIAGSIITTDYVSEGNRAATELKRSEIHISEKQLIQPAAISAPRQDLVPILITVSALVLFGMGIVGGYLLARMKRRTQSY